MGQEHPGRVEAKLTYCVDDGTMPVNETKDMITKMPSYSGNFDQHIMPIENGRQTSQHLKLDVNGFQLVAHNTKVDDFIDENQLQTIYYPEVKELIKNYINENSIF